MSVGLIALLDDIAALTKVAAASIDDIAAQSAKAGMKAAGVVIDDAAVTPGYVVGFAADRELPIVWRIALGSLKNKILFLLPAALALSFFAPWLINPLLMLGGAYLCYEGAEKVYEKLFPHQAHEHEAAIGAAPQDPKELEETRIASAIKTDFILSAEIMAITLSGLPAGDFWTQAAVLAVVGIAITVIVYGAVALIVKADDAGVHLASNPTRSAFGGISRAVGRGLVIGMPYFLKVLTVVGTAAMVWVGGGIIVHGLELYGLPGLGHVIHGAAAAAGQALPAVGGQALPAVGGAVEWIVNATGAGLVGLALGAAIIPLTSYVLAPAWGMLKGLRGQPA